MQGIPPLDCKEDPPLTAEKAPPEPKLFLNCRTHETGTVAPRGTEKKSPPRLLHFRYGREGWYNNTPKGRWAVGPLRFAGRDTGVEMEMSMR